MRYLSNKEIRFVFQYLKDSLPGKPTGVSGLYSLPKVFDHAFNGPTHKKEAATSHTGGRNHIYRLA